MQQMEWSSQLLETGTRTPTLPESYRELTPLWEDSVAPSNMSLVDKETPDTLCYAKHSCRYQAGNMIGSYQRDRPGRNLQHLLVFSHYLLTEAGFNLMTLPPSPIFFMIVCQAYKQFSYIHLMVNQLSCYKIITRHARRV